MSERRRLVFIVNPAAGKGRGGTQLVRLRHLLADTEREAEIFLTQAEGDVERIVGGLSLHGRPLLVAVGGDGTVHELASAVVAREAEDIAMGVLPVGSGNDWAHLAGMPENLQDGLAALLGGVEVEWDVGQVGPLVFANSMGLGLSAEVSEASRRTGPLRGILRYGYAAVRAIAKHHPVHIGLDGAGELDGPHLATLMEVAVGPRAGGGFKLAPKAHPADGLLDLCLVDALPRWKLPLLAPRALAGSHLGHPAVHYEQLAGFRLKLGGERLVHLDGELRRLARGEHVVRVRKKALRVRLPEDRYGALAADPPAGEAAGAGP